MMTDESMRSNRDSNLRKSFLKMATGAEWKRPHVQDRATRKQSSGLTWLNDE